MQMYALFVWGHESTLREGVCYYLYYLIWLLHLQFNSLKDLESKQFSSKFMEHCLEK